MNNKKPLVLFLILLAVSAGGCSGIRPLDETTATAAHAANAAAGPAPEPLSVPLGEPGEAAPDAESAPVLFESEAPVENLSYPVVDTGQTDCYSDQGAIACPQEGDAFYGQDGQYAGLQPAYSDNGDGTVTDLNTGLMWASSPDLTGDGQITIEDKMNTTEALAFAESFSLAGYDDWRLPTIKELYSLMNFSGITGTTPYIDTDYFDFAFGDTAAGEREIDAQFASSTLYTSTTMHGAETMFGLNLADGRIKGYPVDKLFYVYFVRGDTGYGVNAFVDNGDGTISDLATGLTWLQGDSGTFGAGSNGDGGLNWEEALCWCDSLEYAGYDDWRLPDAKELQSIVEYTRSPDATDSPALDPIFEATFLAEGINASGEGNYPYYWSSTTHLDGRNLGKRAVYVAFGEARGFMDFGQGIQLTDVHGAGAQRSDPKSGDPSQFALGMGPQGDVQSIYNAARCVRGDSTSMVEVGAGLSLEAAAATLGISLEALKHGLVDPAPGSLDLAVATAQLDLLEGPRGMPLRWNRPRPTREPASAGLGRRQRRPVRGVFFRVLLTDRVDS